MKLRTLAGLVLCLAPACGSSDPRTLTGAGSNALNAGDYSAAVQNFEKAVAALDSSDPEWKRAKMGLFRARAHLDPSRAKDEFLEFARTNPTNVTDADFTLIASHLGETEGPAALQAAIEVLEAGKVTYKDPRVFDALAKDLIKRAESSGNSEALKSMKGLGY